ncbi:MAG: TonB-dependent receptor [Myxococcota bacterium]|nr:TonB-dependent receptor [Myxococcota bacterium]
MTSIPRTATLIGLLVFSTAAFAQESTEEKASLVSHALLQCSHISGAVGPVEVEVLVLTTGYVKAIRVLSGPDVLHEESMRIANQLRFIPASKDGVYIESTTTVTLQFGSHEHEPDHIENELIIYDAQPDEEDVRARVTLDEDDLAEEGAIEFADTVDSVPGVQKAEGSGAQSKPIIRGHQERRMLILNDGIRHESQKWGLDHGTEIDSFSAERVSIIRGANGARYGTDAIGGVILVQSPSMRDTQGWGGRFRLGGQTNGTRSFGAFRFDGKPKEELPSFRIEGNLAKGAGMVAPDYVLGNTGSTLWNLGISTEQQFKTVRMRVNARRYSLQAGIFFGMQYESPSSFEAQLDEQQPAGADNWESLFEVERAYQYVTHDIVSAHVDGEVGDWGHFEVLYAFQHNRRKEFDRVRESITGPQYDFTLRTHSLDGHLTHHGISLGSAWLEGGIGVQGVFQENVYRGLALLPNFRSFSGGIFAHERLSFDRGDIEFALRYDVLSRAAYLPPHDLDRHLRRGTLEEGECPVNATDMARCENFYQTGAVSLGGIVHVVPERVDLKLDLSTASRFPNVDELYLNGTAPSMPVYALGNPSLNVETTYGISSTLGLRYPWIEAEVSGFFNRIDQYVYFSPVLNEYGNLAYDVTIQGTWPRYGYQPEDVWFFGGDGSLSFFPNAVVGVDVQGASTQAYRIEDGSHLIAIPADRGSVTLNGRLDSLGFLKKTEIGLQLQGIRKQFRVEESQDFGPVVAGYQLLNVNLQSKLGEREEWTLRLVGRNLLNASYREYTSLLRYFADQPGRDIRAQVDYRF